MSGECHKLFYFRLSQRIVGFDVAVYKQVERMPAVFGTILPFDVLYHHFATHQTLEIFRFVVFDVDDEIFYFGNPFVDVIGIADYVYRAIGQARALHVFGSCQNAVQLQKPIDSGGVFNRVVLSEIIYFVCFEAVFLDRKLFDVVAMDSGF